MEHIQDTYKKKPEMIDKIFDHLTKVNLKVDGKPFQVVYNEETDELEYHGRSGNETKVGPLIDDMYRLFSKPINDAIKHIEKRVEVFKKYKFLTFEVISEILLLTAIITKDGKFIDDPDEIDDIAKELDTDVMPCLWKGKINAEQKATLMEAISTDIIPTKDEFVKWVKNLFGTYNKFPKTLISRSTEYIEGIVFFFNVDGKVVEYKLVDPSFRQSVKDNQANMKADNDKNGETYKQIYEIFVDWAKDNASKLDDTRMRSIEFNFIEMMKDAKLYNKLMKLAAGLTTVKTDAYFLQPDRISDELKKAIRQHGNVYQLLYEKFVRLFWKAKKRNYTISKEFQQEVNGICGMIGESLIYESSTTNITNKEIISNLIEYIQTTFEKNSDSLDGLHRIITSWKIASIEDNKDYKEYYSSCGLNPDIVNDMLQNLSLKGNCLALEIIDSIVYPGNNDREAPDFPDTAVPLNKMMTDLGFNDKDAQKLVVHTSNGTTRSDGPGEHAVALFYKNAKKANKGDIVINGNEAIEFKCGGGSVSTSSCNGTISDVWNRIQNILSPDSKEKIEWTNKTDTIKSTGRNVENSNAIGKWFNNIKSKDELKNAEAIVSSINSMFNNKLDIDNKEIIEIISSKNFDGEKFIKMIGCLCLKAYAALEGFSDIMIQSRKSLSNSEKNKPFVHATWIKDINEKSLSSLMKENIIFADAAKNNSRGGGGMTIYTYSK